MMPFEQAPINEEGNKPIVQDNEPEADGALDEIFGDATYKAEPRKKQEFWPWHKPRKQFVRENQWCTEIKKMISEALPENNVLKYLGLPGDDFLDIRYFHEQICLPNNLQLKFLGFNEGIRSEKRKTEINISLDEISRLQFYHPASEVLPDDFCEIAKLDSIAWEKTRQKGPYDIINIDLCDGFGKHPPNQYIETHYNTIARLLSLQAKRLNPWLLLLTTRTSKNDIHEDVLRRLKDVYKSNLNGCAEFQKASSEKLAIGDDDAVENGCNTEKGLSDVFLISLCKWLSQIAITQKSKLEVTSVIGYKVYGKAAYQDLVSIAIRIEPLVIVDEDKIGLAQQQAIDHVPNECTTAIQVLDSIHVQVDADKTLADDKELWTKMLSESARLLEEARYDTTNYKDWATGGHLATAKAQESK